MAMKRAGQGLDNQIRQELLQTIKEVMEQEGVSQGEVARRIGADRPNINKVMCERMKVSIDYLLKIADSIGLDVELKVKKTKS